MGFRGNNVLHKNHFRKDWQRRVKTWFDQPGAKKRRRTARAVKAAKAGPRPTSTLKPAVRCPTVRYNTRLRSGRGFTLEELKLAGIRPKEALSIGISVDHRRRNRSEEGLAVNVDRLKAYKERLILFPKKGGKAKKGDSDEATLKSETTKDLALALPLPPSSKPEEPRPITQAEKDFEAFRTLRVARSDKRHEGVRKIRAEKKAAEEEAKKK